MTPSEFDSLADAMLERIARAVEESGADCDCEPKGSGVLELEFADGSRIVVNRHSAARQIWVAARSGRSEEHTSELQSRQYLVCRLLLEKKKKKKKHMKHMIIIS